MGSKSKSNNSSSSQNVNNSQGVSSGINMNYGVNQSGNFGQNSSSGGGSSFNESTQDVYGAQAPYLQDVYGQAQGAFNQGMTDVNGMRPEVQQQLGDALGAAGQGYGNQMGGGFAGELAGQVGPNSYVDAMKGQVADDAQLLKQQNLGGLDARAAAAGMSGSSGYRDQVNDMTNQVDRNALNQMSQIGYNAHNQGIQNQMQLAGMQDQNQQNAMGNLQNIQQGSMNQFNPAMMGQQMAGQYAQTIGGPTVLGNSSGGSTNFNQSSGTNMGFSNGMNMGMGVNGSANIGNSFGSSTGQGNSNSTTIDPGFAAAGIGALAGSDARLKENIKHVEQIDGINMYTWNWKDPAMSWPMSYGVIAQEVAETHPEAVVTGDHGYMMVDYSKLGRAGEVALARMEG
jgi:hypothetical protein